MQKAFDWVDRDLLFYKLLKYNINGNIYKCINIKAMYNHPMTCVKVNDNITQWFDISSGVRQGDSLSPTLFGLFINDLISEVKALNLGVNINDIIISILAFAGDIVIIAQNQKELQDILHCVEKWCKKWRLKINVGKTNVVHTTDYNFLFDNNVLKIVDKSRYNSSRTFRFQCCSICVG